MAKKMDGDVVVTNNHNQGSYDGAALIADVYELERLAKEHKEAGQPISEMKLFLKHEKGYNMQGVGFLRQLAKLRENDPALAQDVWRTVKAGAEELGLDDPDLVDQAEAKNAE